MAYSCIDVCSSTVKELHCLHISTQHSKVHWGVACRGKEGRREGGEGRGGEGRAWKVWIKPGHAITANCSVVG